jgi:large subunit ribosomal protein L21
MATSYAIVETGGKQYRAEKGGKLLVERLPDDEGSKVNLRAVMFKGDKDVLLDASELEKVKVEAVVAEHMRGPKVRIFKYKAKKGYRRRGGHRQGLTRLEVTEVRLLSRKPAAGAKQAAKKDEPNAKAEAKPKPAPKKGTAKAAPEKKAAPKKPAAKKATSKKPAAKRSGGGAKSSSGGRSSPAKRSSSAKKES